PRQTYLYVALHPSYAYGGDPTAPFAMPTTSATLVTKAGTVTGTPAVPSSESIDAGWYFSVPANLTSATLEVAPFTKVLGNERGDFLTWTITPSPIGFVAQPTTATTVPAPAQSGIGHRPHKGGAPRGAGAPRRTGSPTGSGAENGGGAPLGIVLGAGAGAVLLLGAGAVGLLSAVRRRAFYRADREGRVVLTGPPLIATLPTTARLPEGGEGGAPLPPRAR